MYTLLICLAVLSLPLQSFAQPVDPSDIDGDGLLNTEEDVNGNQRVDTDETDPYNADTDGGGEADGPEVEAGRDPLDRRDDITYDLDTDGLTNGQEFEKGTNPAKKDTDDDGLNDFDDPFPLDQEYTRDSDKDGLPDSYETKYGLQPDKRSDALEDLDGDGLNNLDEFVLGTNIQQDDSDNDGLPDGQEVARGSDPLENPCLELAAPGDVLHDLEGHWAQDYVSSLQRTKAMPDGIRIVQGYSTAEGQLFKPNQHISRYELLKLALLSSCIVPDDVSEGDFVFQDLRRQGRPHERDDIRLRREIIYAAYDRGIIDGYADKTFRANDPINRAEALKILLNTAILEPFDDGDYQGLFSDVDDNAWYAPFLHTALSYEFIEGYNDGTFRPEQPITRAEASKVVLFIMISNPHVNGYVVPVEE